MKHILLGCSTAALAWAISPGYGQTYGPNPNVNYDVPNYAYSPQPNVSVRLSGGGGDGAYAVPMLGASGSIAKMIVVDQGLGYTSAPIITITGSGSKASATAQIDPNLGTVTNIVVNTAGSGYGANGLRKFVDFLPGLGPTATNNLGQYLPLAQVTKWPINNTDDYYEIAAVEWTERMHSDLPGPTRLRGYVQIEPSYATNGIPAGSAHVALKYPNGSPITFINGAQVYAYAAPHYLGPVIVAAKGVSTRIKFYNFLPVGADGQLFIPVDTTVMGAGMGPLGMKTKPYDMNYKQNRMCVHLHGGNTPWISDGTPHQWLVPWNETNTPPSYRQGVSKQNVPDMPTPEDGAVTLYYSNDQSSRLMFYHDHCYGTTRLNVYAGVAAGYLVKDPTGVGESTLGISAVTNQIPLIIQDKTFIWDPAGNKTSGTYTTDPSWATTITNSHVGDLWFPHIYMPNQDPYSPDGFTAYGRWDYGPWFWPVFPASYDMPLVSCVPEAFMDTPVVNGTVYPYVNVQPKAYRFRLLNACNDRYLDLSLWLANTNCYAVDINGNSTTLGTGYGTEVRMVPFSHSQNVLTPFPLWWYEQNLLFTLDDRVGGVPDPTTRGPAMVQIGTEGGLLPAPALVKNQPINYDYDRRSVTALNIKQHALLLGPAECADIVVDFSNFSGKTLILYNDAPAPLPAGDPRNEPFTGAPDWTSMGGVSTTIPGYGPNIRTIMQIRVAAGGSSTTPVDDYNAADFATLSTTLPAAFAATQPPIIVPEAAYNAAYNNGSPNTYSYISNTSLTFGTNSSQTLTGVAIVNGGGGYTNVPTVTIAPAAGGTGPAVNATATLTSGVITAITLPAGAFAYNGTPVVTIVPPTRGKPAQAIAITTGTRTIALQPKCIQELFDPYGRMNTTLGTELPFTTATIQTTIPLGYIDPPTEIINDGETQIWKITHNGVDTQAIHFHLFNAQVINRMGWDGAIKPPDANELGWKDTIRMNPLEDIVIALRPVAQTVPFTLPHSVRPLNPAMPLGDSTGFTSVDPTTGNPLTVVNTNLDFGWEYVWHCHLLGHEENDMIRPIIFQVYPPAAPSSFKITALSPIQVYLRWVNNATNTPTFTIQRSTNSNFPSTPAGATVTFLTGANATSYTDTVSANTTYYYRLRASNAAGNTAWLNASVTTPFAAPPATISPSNSYEGPLPTYTWKGIPGATTGYQVMVSNNLTHAVTTSPWLTPTQVGSPTGAGNGSYPQPASLAIGSTYTWYARAQNATGASAWSAGLFFAVQAPTAPTAISPTGTGVSAQPNYTFTRVAGATQYRIALYNDAAASQTLSTWFTAAQVDPTGTSTTGTIAQATPLAVGKYTWSVEAYNAVGASPWSASLAFSVGAAPAAPTPVSPSGAGAATQPNYTFTKVAGATQYRIALYNVTTASQTLSSWFTAAQVDPTGTRTTGTIAQATPLAVGKYTWSVEAYNAVGASPWSASLAFSVGAAPAAPTPVSPSGAGAGTQPNYTFAKVAGATQYRIAVYNLATATQTVTAWFTAAQVDPTGARTTGTIAQATPLAAGKYTWCVEAYNNAGVSPWSASLAFSVP